MKMANNNNLASTIYNTLGINIVTCGNCGAVNLHKVGLEEITCEYCDDTSDICDFPDLFDVTDSQEGTLTWTSPKCSHIREELKNLIDEGCNTEYTRGALEIISSFMKPSDDGMIHADIAIQLAKDLGIPQENIDKLY